MMWGQQWLLTTCTYSNVHRYIMFVRCASSTPVGALSVLLLWSSVVIPCLSFYFFFQAEDGIRDVAVTGVQTCALPILCSHLWPPEWRRSSLSSAPRRRPHPGRKVPWGIDERSVPWLGQYRPHQRLPYQIGRASCRERV